MKVVNFLENVIILYYFSFSYFFTEVFASNSAMAAMIPQHRSTFLTFSSGPLVSCIKVFSVVKLLARIVTDALECVFPYT